MYRQVLAASAALILLASTAAIAVNETPYLSAQRLVDVGGGRRLNIYCTGAGSQTVILDGAIGSSAFVWNKVQPQLANHVRVCSYDRAGYGFSDPGGLPHTTSANVKDLHALLRNAHIAPPYVLVTHSLNGFDGWIFADRYRGELAGLVQIEPSNVEEGRFATIEGQKKFDAANAADLQFMNACARKARRHQLKAGDDCVGPNDPKLSTRLNKIEKEHSTSPSMWDAVLSERMSLPADIREVKREQRAYGNLPLIVLTAGMTQDAPDSTPPQRLASKHLWAELRAQDAARSNLGVNCVVAGAGHYIQLDKPNVVSAAVLEIMRSGSKGRKPDCTRLH
ncbi:MAG: alpha/beta hydrolase [Candidatus Eremiobacteraeota bacterium]|nr:alpha/beta hydrolase [Candidatus Eremiobacteraeota bacterium]